MYFKKGWDFDALAYFSEILDTMLFKIQMYFRYTL